MYSPDRDVNSILRYGPLTMFIGSPPPGIRIKIARTSAGLTQPELAKKLGVSRPTLFRMESETNGRDVELDVLLRVGEICEIPEAFMRHGWGAVELAAVVSALDSLADDLRAARDLDVHFRGDSADVRIEAKKKRSGGKPPAKKPRSRSGSRRS